VRCRSGKARADGPDRSRRFIALHLPAAQIRAAALAGTLLLAACGDPKPPPPPAPSVPLSPEQRTVIDALNRLGQEDVAGRTHAYEFRPPCTLVVHERFEARPKPGVPVALKGIEVRVLEYVAGAGFGLKASVPGAPGSFDVFESKHDATAKEAGELVRRLAATCS
jgi:hypothetical protein